jgi:hypothetical protein
MPDDRTPVAGTSHPDRTPIAGRSPANRSATTNDPTKRLGRSADARRIKDLFGSYMARLGHPDDIGVQALVLDAAEMVVVCEAARAAYLAKPTVDDLEIINRTQGKADKALRRLGVDKIGKPPRKSLAEKIEAVRKAAEGTPE